MSLNEKLVEIFEPFLARLEEANDPPHAVSEILSRIITVLDEHKENFNNDEQIWKDSFTHLYNYLENIVFKTKELNIDEDLEFVCKDDLYPIDSLDSHEEIVHILVFLNKINQSFASRTLPGFTRPVLFRLVNTQNPIIVRELLLLLISIGDRGAETDLTVVGSLFDSIRALHEPLDMPLFSPTIPSVEPFSCTVHLSTTQKQSFEKLSEETLFEFFCRIVSQCEPYSNDRRWRFHLWSTLRFQFGITKKEVQNEWITIRILIHQIFCLYNYQKEATSQKEIIDLCYQLNQLETWKIPLVLGVLRGYILIEDEAILYAIKTSFHIFASTPQQRSLLQLIWEYIATILVKLDSSTLTEIEEEVIRNFLSLLEWIGVTCRDVLKEPFYETLANQLLCFPIVNRHIIYYDILLTLGKTFNKAQEFYWTIPLLQQFLRLGHEWLQHNASNSEILFSDFTYSFISSILQVILEAIQEPRTKEKALELLQHSDLFSGVLIVLEYTNVSRLASLFFYFFHQILTADSFIATQLIQMGLFATLLDWIQTTNQSYDLTGSFANSQIVFAMRWLNSFLHLQSCFEQILQKKSVKSIIELYCQAVQWDAEHVAHLSQEIVSYFVQESFQEHPSLVKDIYHLLMNVTQSNLIPLLRLVHAICEKSKRFTLELLRQQQYNSTEVLFVSLVHSINTPNSSIKTAVSFLKQLLQLMLELDPSIWDNYYKYICNHMVTDFKLSKQKHTTVWLHNCLHLAIHLTVITSAIDEESLSTVSSKQLRQLMYFARMIDVSLSMLGTPYIGQRLLHQFSGNTEQPISDIHFDHPSTWITDEEQFQYIVQATTILEQLVTHMSSIENCLLFVAEEMSEWMHQSISPTNPMSYFFYQQSTLSAFCKIIYQSPHSSALLKELENCQVIQILFEQLSIAMPLCLEKLQLLETELHQRFYPIICTGDRTYLHPYCIMMEQYLTQVLKFCSLWYAKHQVPSTATIELMLDMCNLISKNLLSFRYSKQLCNIIVNLIAYIKVDISNEKVDETVKFCLIESLDSFMMDTKDKRVVIDLTCEMGYLQMYKTNVAVLFDKCCQPSHAEQTAFLQLVTWQTILENIKALRYYDAEWKLFVYNASNFTNHLVNVITQESGTDRDVRTVAADILDLIVTPFVGMQKFNSSISGKEYVYETMTMSVLQQDQLSRLFVYINNRLSTIQPNISEEELLEIIALLCTLSMTCRTCEAGLQNLQISATKLFEMLHVTLNSQCYSNTLFRMVSSLIPMLTETNAVKQFSIRKEWSLCKEEKELLNVIPKTYYFTCPELIHQELVSHVKRQPNDKLFIPKDSLVMQLFEYLVGLICELPRFDKETPRPCFDHFHLLKFITAICSYFDLIDYFLTHEKNYLQIILQNYVQFPYSYGSIICNYSSFKTNTQLDMIHIQQVALCKAVHYLLTVMYSKEPQKLLHHVRLAIIALQDQFTPMHWMALLEWILQLIQLGPSPQVVRHLLQQEYDKLLIEVVLPRLECITPVTKKVASMGLHILHECMLQMASVDHTKEEEKLDLTKFVEFFATFETKHKGFDQVLYFKDEEEKSEEKEVNASEIKKEEQVTQEEQQETEDDVTPIHQSIDLNTSEASQKIVSSATVEESTQEEENQNEEQEYNTQHEEQDTKHEEQDVEDVTTPIPQPTDPDHPSSQIPQENIDVVVSDDGDEEYETDEEESDEPEEEAFKPAEEEETEEEENVDELLTSVYYKEYIVKNAIENRFIPSVGDIFFNVLSAQDDQAHIEQVTSSQSEQENIESVPLSSNKPLSPIQDVEKVNITAHPLSSPFIQLWTNLQQLEAKKYCYLSYNDESIVYYISHMLMIAMTTLPQHHHTTVSLQLLEKITSQSLLQNSINQWYPMVQFDKNTKHAVMEVSILSLYYLMKSLQSNAQFVCKHLFDTEEKWVHLFSYLYHLACSKEVNPLLRNYAIYCLHSMNSYLKHYKHLFSPMLQPKEWLSVLLEVSHLEAMIWPIVLEWSQWIDSSSLLDYICPLLLSHAKQIQHQLVQWRSSVSSFSSLLYTSLDIEKQFVKLMEWYTRFISITKMESSKVFDGALDLLWEQVERSCTLVQQNMENYKQNVLPVLVLLIEAFAMFYGMDQQSHKRVVDSETVVMEEKEELIDLMTVHYTPTPNASNVFGMTSKIETFLQQHKTLFLELLQLHPPLLDYTFALVKKYPHLFDFETKRNYFYHQLEHQNETETVFEMNVKREELLSTAMTALLKATPQQLKQSLKIVFENEQGNDLGGVRREFFMQCCKELFNEELGLFTSALDQTTFQPNPLSHVIVNLPFKDLELFFACGRFIAMAVFHNTLIDAHFTRSVYKQILQIPLSFRDLEFVDIQIYRTLKWLYDNDISSSDLGLYFETDVEDVDPVTHQQVKKQVLLKPHGNEILVNNDNKLEYIKLFTNYKLTSSVAKQLEAFLRGFYEIISKELICIFNEQELELLICGLPRIDLDDLRKNTEYIMYTKESPQIGWFWNTVEQMTDSERALLLQFVTGSSKVPLQGFKGLMGNGSIRKFNIVRVPTTERLPSAHVCFNQLELPEYTSEQELKEKLMTAISYASFGFELV